MQEADPDEYEDIVEENDNDNDNDNDSDTIEQGNDRLIQSDDDSVI